MDNVKIYLINTDIPEQVEKTTGLLTPEAEAAVKKKLPVTLILAALDNKAAGALAGAIDKGIFVIESLYVAPEYRRQGVGTALINKLREILLEDDMMIRAEYTKQNEDDELLSVFLRRTGFKPERIILPMYYISNVGSLDINLRDKEKEKYREMVIPFSKVPDRIIRAASANASREHQPVPEGGLLSADIDRDSSFCVLINGTVKAYIVIEKMRNDMIEIPAIWSALSDPRVMMIMLQEAAAELKKKYDPDTRTAMIALNSMSDKIIKHLFPNAVPCSYSFISI